MRDRPAQRGTRIRVGSVTVVVSGENDPPEDRPNRVSVVQQNPVVINRLRGSTSAGRQNSAEEWI